jgi:hypothetical protein
LRHDGANGRRRGRRIATPVTTSPTVALGGDVAVTVEKFAAGSTGTTSLIAGGTNRMLTLCGSGVSFSGTPATRS